MFKKGDRVHIGKDNGEVSEELPESNQVRVRMDAGHSIKIDPKLLLPEVETPDSDYNSLTDQEKKSVRSRRAKDKAEHNT